MYMYITMMVTYVSHGQHMLFAVFDTSIHPVVVRVCVYVHVCVYTCTCTLWAHVCVCFLCECE